VTADRFGDVPHYPRTIVLSPVPWQDRNHAHRQDVVRQRLVDDIPVEHPASVDRFRIAVLLITHRIGDIDDIQAVIYCSRTVEVGELHLADLRLLLRLPAHQEDRAAYPADVVVPVVVSGLFVLNNEKLLEGNVELSGSVS